MWAKFITALGFGEGGRTGIGRRTSAPEGASSPLTRHERSIDEMRDFERDLRKFEKHVRDYKASTEVFLGGFSAFLRDSQLPRLYDTVPATAGPTDITTATTAPTDADSTSAATPEGAPSAPPAPSASPHGPGEQLVVVE
ncbi:hypothetical protein Agub_g13187, partial [Astrephomene gubernaculifera]